jgi:uncharacterized protein (TIGR03000 family)
MSQTLTFRGAVLAVVTLCLAVGLPAAAQNAALQSRPATITVKVPAEAELWIDGHKMTTQGPARVFVSPALPNDRDHFYDLRARWRSKEGGEIERGRRVYFRAGEQLVVDFQGPGGTIAVTPPPLSLSEGHVYPLPETGPGRGVAVPQAPGGFQGSPPVSRSSAGFTLPGTGTSPSTSGYSPGISSPPGGGVFPSTSGVSGNRPGTGVFPSTSATAAGENLMFLCCGRNCAVFPRESVGYNSK